MDRGFELAQWGTSSKAVLMSLPGVATSTRNMDLEDLPVERTLGLILDFNQDAFLIRTKAPNNGNTKRELLSTLSSSFDPLGFLVPVLFPAKLILQRVCRDGIAWDDAPDDATIKQWKAWVDGLSSLQPLAIPRCYTLDDPIAVDLHTFADALELGFGAVTYLRFVHERNIELAFVMAKSRVSPQKFVSIPRLELCAALLAVRLHAIVKKELRFPIRHSIFWSDSTTTLSWISSKHCKFHIYVANRVGEVLESTEPSQWKYVPTALNPADDCTRGLDSAELNIRHRFLAGPSFLLEEEETWPLFPGEMPQVEEDDPEVRWIGSTQLATSEPVSEFIENSSRCYKLLRVVAYILRFVHNTRFNDCRKTGELTALEIRDAKLCVIRIAQLKAYEIHNLNRGRQIPNSSNIISLNPQFDNS